jgi:hypothetical protein
MLGSVALELTSDDLREIDSAASKITVLVHHFRDWYSSVAIKMGRRQGATKEHI